MKKADKFHKIANEFLIIFDASELSGRKKNLVRAVDAFCSTVRYNYPTITLSDVANMVNKYFDKNNKNYRHSDVIFAERRHLARMEDSLSGDLFYRECYNEVILKLTNNNIIPKHEKKQQEQRVDSI
jgi:hypothetical protein